MIFKRLAIGASLLFCTSLAGCLWSSQLSTQWSENFALATYGAEATPPEFNDGKLETIAVVAAKNERIFMLKFPAVKRVRKIIIHNDNLFRFDVDYWDTDNLEWKTVYSVRQRRDIENQRAQSEYVLERLNFQTNMIRINVSRTVDDDVVNKPIAEPGDKVVNRKLTVGGLYYPHYRVIKPGMAKLREIEVYNLAANQ